MRIGAEEKIPGASAQFCAWAKMSATLYQKVFGQATLIDVDDADLIILARLPPELQPAALCKRAADAVADHNMIQQAHLDQVKRTL